MPRNARMGPDIHPQGKHRGQRPSDPTRCLNLGSIATTHQHLLKNPGKVLLIKAKEAWNLCTK